MNKGLLLSFFSLVTVLGMVTMASAGSVDWQYLTDTSALNKGPGPDGLMGTGDDVADSTNAPGALSTGTITWGDNDPPCEPAQTITYSTGIEVDCLGTPADEYTTTYMKVVQTETLPDTGSLTIILTPGGGPNTGDNCGLGSVHSTKETTMIISVVGYPAQVPMGESSTDAMVYDADAAITSDWTCPANSIVYTAAYLDSIRQLLPPSAEGLMVACSSTTFELAGIPCYDGALVNALIFAWTDDDPEDCASPCCDDDGDDIDGPQCGGDDCDDSDPAKPPCGGSCAGGPAG